MSTNNKTTQLHVILDVDGVTRLDVNSAADPRVIDQVNKILQLERSTPQLKDKIRFTFLSGTHSSEVKLPPQSSPTGLPPQWRTPNLPLAKVFDKCFDKTDFDSGRLSIFGQLGCDTAVVEEEESSDSNNNNSNNKSTLTGQVIRGFDDDVRIKLLEMVLKSYGEFLRDTNNFTKEEFDEFCSLLSSAVNKCLVTKECPIPKDHTADVFEEVAAFARQKSNDPILRIISHKGSAEIGCLPKKNSQMDLRVDTLKMLDYIKDKVSHCDDKRISTLLDRVSAGVAHIDGAEFCWACVTASNKGIACFDLLRMYRLGEKEQDNDVENAENKKYPATRPNVSIITVGDSHVDFSMHELTAPNPNNMNDTGAHLYHGQSFHVGPPSTLEKLSKQHPEKYSHVTFVPLEQCQDASKITTGMTEEMKNKMEHLHGKTDVMPLTTGTLEVLLRLEAVLKAAVGDGSKEEIDFTQAVQQVSHSFKN